MIRRFLLPGQNKRFARHLSEAIIIEDGILFWNYRLILIATMVLGTAFLFFMAFYQVDEAVKTTGQFHPRGFVRTIQAAEGGIVAKLFVQDSDLVAKGDMLLQLDNMYTISEREQTLAKMAGLKARAARLNAYLRDTPPDFAGIDLVKYGDLYRDQLSLLRNQNQVRHAGLSVIDTQIAQKKAEVAVYEEQIRNAKLRGGVSQNLLSLRDDLAKKKLVSRMTQLMAQKDQLGSEGEVQNLVNQLTKSRQSLIEVENRRKVLESELHNQASHELGNTLNELVQTQKTLDRLEEKKERMFLVAPVRGRIQNLRVRTIGGVVRSGDPLMEIVPADDELNLEVRIPPKDIGFVKPGQAVIIKVNSYDYTLYGTVNGILVSISPFTFMDIDKKIYYKGIIHPHAKWVEQEDKRFPILPGMDALAEIITGQRLLLTYLIKPLMPFMNFHHETGLL